MSYEIRIDDDGRAICKLGVIKYPWPVPSEDSRYAVAAIGPMILVDGITMMGLEMWEWLYESGGFAAWSIRTGRRRDSRSSWLARYLDAPTTSCRN